MEAHVSVKKGNREYSQVKEATGPVEDGANNHYWEDPSKNEGQKIVASFLT